jgi:hypothetical protein
MKMSEHDQQQDGTAHCGCGWSVDAKTENQAVAAAVGHGVQTGHTNINFGGDA